MDRNENEYVKNGRTNITTILLLGGTGKVTRRIAPFLSTNGYNVLLASRSGSSPSSLPNTKGVKFDWLDVKTYGNPFISVSPNGKAEAKEILIDAVFMIAPPILDALPLAKKFIDELIEKGVRRIVFLSGSIQHCGDGPILSQISEYIKEKGGNPERSNDINSNTVEWTILRPSWFMENFSEMHHKYTIRDEGQIISATGKGKIPFVSVQDVANVAYRALIGWRSDIGRGLAGSEVFLRGNELWSYDDIAELLTKTLGREIRHVNVEEDDIVKGMVEGGVERDLAGVLVELDIAVKRGEEENLGGDLEWIIGGRGGGLREYVEGCARGGVWDVRERVEKVEGGGGLGEP